MSRNEVGTHLNVALVLGKEVTYQLNFYTVNFRCKEPLAKVGCHFKKREETAEVQSPVKRSCWWLISSALSV